MLNSTGVICNSKAAASAALMTIAEALPKGIQRDSLLAVNEWISGNFPQDFTEETRERIKRIWEGTEWEQKGRAWLDRELSDYGYTPGNLASDGQHYTREMITEPPDGAEFSCYWNSGKKRWEPDYSWPVIEPQADIIEGEEN